MTKGHGLTLSKSISVGSLIQAVGLAAGLIYGYASLSARVDETAAREREHYESLVEEIRLDRADLEDIEDRVNALEVTVAGMVERLASIDQHVQMIYTALERSNR